MLLNCNDMLWTLRFASSTFTGKCSESLVQALYCCPLIKGLSFVKNANWQSIWSSDSEDEGQDTSGLLANLAGSLPPWVACVIYDNALSDFAPTSLVAILETLGRLSVSQIQNVLCDLLAGDAKEAWLASQKQGSFQSLAVCNSCHLGFVAWKEFYGLLWGTSGHDPLSRVPPLVSLLWVLDISSIELGDELLFWDHVRDMKSGCCLEQLDLAENCSCEGSYVVRV